MSWFAPGMKPSWKCQAEIAGIPPFRAGKGDLCSPRSHLPDGLPESGLQNRSQAFQGKTK